MREKKYYKIRVDVFWMIVICVVTFVIAKNYGKIRLPKQEKNETDIIENWQETEATTPVLLSKLKDKKRCYLCGSSDYSMMDYYRKFDTIGLISLNDWQVLAFQLKNYDEYGKEIKDKGSNQMFFGNIGEMSYHSQGTPSRGMAEINVTLPDDYKLNTDVIENNLCQKCLNKVTSTLKYRESEDEEKKTIPLCLIDFDTLEIYSLQDYYRAYFIRDYWVEMEFEENKIVIKTFYLPEK